MPQLKQDTDKETITFRHSTAIIAMCQQAGILLDMPVTEVYRQVFTEGLGSFFKNVSLTLDTSSQMEEFGAPNAFRTPGKAAAFRKLRAHSKVKVAQSNKTRSEEDKAS
jgi:hypothetical protein